MVESGTDITTVQKLMGHKDNRSTCAEGGLRLLG
ncbi:site-specific integrase [Rubripirellula lacrimiformis]|nr:site-specific integrase [Rubripirellula lacrimiformis]